MSQQIRQRTAGDLPGGREANTDADREVRAWRDAGPTRSAAGPLLVRRQVFRTWIDADGRTHGRWTWDYA
jgi:hypothetical protein